MGANVYTILPATEPSNDYIVTGAHYDSPEDSPGANDNATGCALAQKDRQPRNRGFLLFGKYYFVGIKCFGRAFDVLTVNDTLSVS